MATVHVPSQLGALIGGSSPLRLEGSNVGELIASLEAAHPRTRGWVVNEVGALRPHVKVFVNGESAGMDGEVGNSDEVRILPAISGGAEDPVEVLVGTRKGLFVLRGPRSGDLGIAGRAFDGAEVEYAIRDRRTGTYLASVTNPYYGPRIHLTEDPTGEWVASEGPLFPDGVDATVQRTWVIHPGVEDGVLWAGVAPAALFRSDDGGRNWELNRGLWDQPTRPQWEGGAGGLCLHSICPWPGDPQRLSVGISAVGVWHTEDGGESWHRGVKGLVARYLPDDASADSLNLCVHNLHRSLVDPTTMYLQFHGGVYRSDDAGEAWTDIGTGGGLPSDFGFPMIVDPRDADRAWVIPLVADIDRVTPEGKVRVYETADRGETWIARTEGLPQENGYLTILRQAFGDDGRDPLGLYFGATSGELFGSADAGRTWRTLAFRLPPINSVRASL